MLCHRYLCHCCLGKLFWLWVGFNKDPHRMDFLSFFNHLMNQCLYWAIWKAHLFLLIPVQSTFPCSCLWVNVCKINCVKSVFKIASIDLALEIARSPEFTWGQDGPNKTNSVKFKVHNEPRIYKSEKWPLMRKMSFRKKKVPILNNLGNLADRTTCFALDLACLKTRL